MIHRLFNYNKWVSVKAVLLGLGQLNVSYQIMLRKINFYRHLFTSENRVLSTAFQSFVLQRCGEMVNLVQNVPEKMAQSLWHHIFATQSCSFQQNVQK